MNKLIANTLAVGIMALALNTQAAAVPLFPGGDFPANSIVDITGSSSLDEANVLKWLEVVASGFGMPAPTPFAATYDGGAIETGDYLVLLYAGGTQGNPAGGLSAFYFDSPATTFAVAPNGPGPNGPGALVFARLYDHVGVPDGGATWILLGLGLAGATVARRLARTGN